VKVFNTAAGGVFVNGDALVLKEPQSAGGGDARQPLLPKSWTVSLSSTEAQTYLKALMVRGGIAANAVDPYYEALKVGWDTHTTLATVIADAVSRSTVSGTPVLQDLMRGLASTTQEHRHLYFSSHSMRMATLRNIADSIAFSVVLQGAITALKAEEPALSYVPHPRAAGLFGHLKRQEDTFLFTKQAITAASAAAEHAFSGSLAALDPFILRVKKADSRVKLAHGWWASNRERLLPGFEPHPHPGNIFMQKLITDLTADYDNVVLNAVRATGLTSAQVTANPQQWWKPRAWEDPLRNAFTMTRDGVELFMTPWSSQAPSFGVWYMVTLDTNYRGTTESARAAIRFAHDGTLHVFDEAHVQYLLMQQIPGLDVTVLIASGGLPNFANLRLMVDLGFPAVAQPDVAISGFAQSFKHTPDLPVQFDPSDSASPTNYIAVSEVYYSFPQTLTPLVDGPVLTVTPKTPANSMVMHGTVVSGAGSLSGEQPGFRSAPIATGIQVIERVVRPVVGGTSDDSALEDATWVVMNQPMVNEQAERFYTHTFRQLDDGTWKAYVCMFTDRVILEPAYSPDGVQYPLLHPQNLDFTYNTGNSAFDADLARFRELVLNQQSPTLEPIVDGSSEIDTAAYALGFRYRGMYGVMAPDDYVLPFSDGGLISLRALALEVKNPGITKADGEDVWLNNFRNTFFTQYGIVQDSFKLRVGLAVLLVDHLNAVTEVQLFGTGNTRASTGLTFTNTSVPAGALLAGSLNSHLLPHSTGGAWHAVGPPPIHDAADPVANRFSFIDSQRRTLEAAI